MLPANESLFAQKRATVVERSSVWSNESGGMKSATKEIANWMRLLPRLLRWLAIYSGPPRDVTVDTLNGLLTFDSRDWLIGKYLYVKQSHEEREIRSAIELLRGEGYLANSAAGSTVLNVGANIGMTCIGLIKAGYFERAIAFEPAPTNYRLLVKNISQNGLADAIRTFPFALSCGDGELVLELSEQNSGDHRIRQTDLAGFFEEEKRRSTSVTARALDNLFEPEKGKVDLVWVDIQGHEGHFFRGAQQFLAKGIPVVSEFWPYGIQRSGMTEREFVESVSGLFSHFWVVGSENFRGAPIGDIGKLFDIYSGPRNFGLVVLARGRP